MTVRSGRDSFHLPLRAGGGSGGSGDRAAAAWMQQRAGLESQRISRGQNGKQAKGNGYGW